MPQVNIPGNSRRLFARGIKTQTLTGNVTLSGLDVYTQVMNPNGTARNVTLPALTSSFGLGFRIINSDTVAALTVKTAAAVTVVVVAAGAETEVLCDGATWTVISPAGGGIGPVYTDFVSHSSAQGTNEVFSTYSLPANTLLAAGSCVKVHFWGVTAATNNNKLVRLAFGATPFVTLTTGAIGANSNNKDWEITATIWGLTSSSQIIDPSGSTFAGVRLANTGVLSAVEDATTALTIASQNTAATAAADIIQKGFTVEVLH